jgi:hypothetical protein
LEERFREMLNKEHGLIDDSYEKEDKQVNGGFMLDDEEKCFLKAHRMSGQAKLNGVLEFVDTMLESK